MPNKAKLSKKLVSVIIPTYNEGKTIGKIIREVKDLNGQFPIEVIVIDAHSSDKTVEIAKKEGVKIIVRDKKYGKGTDFWLASQKAKGDYVVQIDADYQFSPRDIPLMVKSLENGADVVLGKRISHKDAPFIRTLGNFIFCSFTSILLGKRIEDVVAGFKAFRTPALLSLNLKESHFGYEGEVVVKAVRMGYIIDQVPVSYKPRTTGKSQVDPLRDGFLTLWSILKARFAKLEKIK